MNASPLRRRLPPNPRRLTKAFWLLATLMAFGGCTHQNSGTPIGVVMKGDLVQRVTIAGTVIPNKRTVLMPPYQGYVKKLYVKVGDYVKAGDPIISVTQSLSAASEIYPMRAPFSGRVMQVYRTEGEWVDDKTTDAASGNVMVRIDDITKLFVAGDAPELDMVKIKVGQEAVIKAAAILTREYHGIVREISLAAREKKDAYRATEKVEFPIRVEVTDGTENEGLLKPGMSVLVDVIAAKRAGVLMLPHEFVQRAQPAPNTPATAQGTDKYFVVLEDGTRRDIEVGMQNEEAFEITKGVSEGDRVKPADFAAIGAQGMQGMQ